MAPDNRLLYGAVCSLCSEKLGFTERDYTHILADGTLCHRCQRTIQQLLSLRKLWTDNSAYLEAMGKHYSPTGEHTLPLERAQALLALRDSVCARFLQDAGLTQGSVFAAQEVFCMPPSPAIFILRARKLRNKAVLQGFALSGEIRKGDRVTLCGDGGSRSFTALDVVPAETDALKKETFFDLLGTNVHRHRVETGGSGWIILDTEDGQSIPAGSFAAAHR